MPLQNVAEGLDLMRMGERLRKARGDMTREELSGLIECSLSSIKNWENGKSEPPLSILIRIAKVTRTNPIRLAFGDMSELEDEEQAELVNAILGLEEDEKKTAKEVIQALSLKSHARRLNR